MTIARHTHTYWLERAVELRFMAKRSHNEDSKKVLSCIADCFDKLAQLDDTEIGHLIGEWDQKRRQDFLEALVTLPFTEKVHDDTGLDSQN